MISSSFLHSHPRKKERTIFFLTTKEIADLRTRWGKKRSFSPLRKNGRGGGGKDRRRGNILLARKQRRGQSRQLIFRREGKKGGRENRLFTEKK